MQNIVRRLRACLSPYICAAALAVVPAQAGAGTLACVGTVENVSFHSPGRYMLKLSSMNVPVFFCSPDLEWVVPGTGYTTTPANCRMLYATFLAAKLAGGTLNYVHFDGDQVPASCDAWPNWSIANIRYFRY
jgi:hypothetical protein